ncbi:CD180 antigen-like [Diadema setosum]|uniref:CD180 antigen-like n=1 Tax=Diadema setosum TaxID=31175 RepID=UPI003B3B5B17
MLFLGKTRLAGFILMHVIIFIILKTVYAADRSMNCEINLDSRSATCVDMGLSSVPEYLPDNTENLSLGGNQITVLHNTSFFAYKQLRVLAINANNISFIESGTFLMLSFLHYLRLSDNPFLPALRGNMFASTNLTVILLDNTNLAYLSHDLFKAMISNSDFYFRWNALQNVNWTGCHNVSFEYISFLHNNLTEISEQSFVMDCTAGFLDLAYNPIRLVSPAIISSLKVKDLDMSGILLPERELRHLLEGVGSSSTITSLSIRSIGLTSIRPGLFSALHGKQLDWLNLGSNELKQLIPQGFENLTNVSELVLDSNRLEVIEPSYFSGMSSLQVLNLESNNISVINVDNSLWNANLITSFFLQHNSFERIGTHAFNGLKNLRVLDLSENDFNKLTSFSLSDLESLNILKLIGCSFTVKTIIEINAHTLTDFYLLAARGIPRRMISPGTLQRNTPLLQKIILAESYININYLWDFQKDISSFEGLLELRVLDLSFNDMSSAPPDFFRNLTSLRELYLDHCDLSVRPPPVDGLCSLQILSLSDNHLHYIPHNFLNDTVQLRDLSLASNFLVYLHSDIFRNVVNLTRLDLTLNRFVTLHFTTFEPILETLSVIGLALNPWNCNCSLQWLPKWVAEKSIDAEKSAGVICSGDGSFKSAAGKLLWDFDPVRECGPQFMIYLSAAGSAVCTILALVLIYHNRWKIRYVLFLCKIHFIGYREIIAQQQREHFQYDMYVAIHGEDEEWTDEIFRRGLEENLPEYDRLAIGDEALRLGMYYLDSVSLLVENSFKVIFLISADALKNHMFLLKFRLALDHVNELQMEKIVLVFLEDIPDANLPFLIRLFLSDNRAYLVWPRDPEGQAYFWEQLAKYMAVNRYCNPLVPP